LPVPHPKDGQLFVKLRDDPSVINLASIDTREVASTPQEAERESARHAAASSPSSEPPPKPTPAPPDVT
jgi:hypothetical protein